MSVAEGPRRRGIERRSTYGAIFVFVLVFAASLADEFITADPVFRQDCSVRTVSRSASFTNGAHTTPLLFLNASQPRHRLQFPAGFPFPAACPSVGTA